MRQQQKLSNTDHECQEAAKHYHGNGNPESGTIMGTEQFR